MDKKLLESIGMTSGEVSVYLALLDLGISSTGNIIKKSNVSSSKVYLILERLLQKGLISQVDMQHGPKMWWKINSLNAGNKATFSLRRENVLTKNTRAKVKKNRQAKDSQQCTQNCYQPISHK